MCRSSTLSPLPLHPSPTPRSKGKPDLHLDGEQLYRHMSTCAGRLLDEMFRRKRRNRCAVLGFVHISVFVSFCIFILLTIPAFCFYVALAHAFGQRAIPSLSRWPSTSCSILTSVFFISAHSFHCPVALVTIPVVLTRNASTRTLHDKNWGFTKPAGCNRLHVACTSKLRLGHRSQKKCTPYSILSMRAPSLEDILHR